MLFFWEQIQSDPHLTKQRQDCQKEQTQFQSLLTTGGSFDPKKFVPGNRKQWAQCQGQLEKQKQSKLNQALLMPAQNEWICKCKRGKEQMKEIDQHISSTSSSKNIDYKQTIAFDLSHFIRQLYHK